MEMPIQQFGQIGVFNDGLGSRKEQFEERIKDRPFSRFYGRCISFIIIIKEKHQKKLNYHTSWRHYHEKLCRYFGRSAASYDPNITSKQRCNFSRWECFDSHISNCVIMVSRASSSPMKRTTTGSKCYQATFVTFSGQPQAQISTSNQLEITKGNYL